MELFIALKLIWAVLLGVLLTGIGAMVGMDMGVGTLLRFVGRSDAERRTALNIIGPHWDGNQVWFILGGGAIFAAFPTLYATSFSVFYVVMILLLFSMILRPVAFEYRSKVAAPAWRNVWDWAFLVSGALPMLVYGAAFGNIMEGVGFHYSWTGQYYQDESFLSYLLNPFALLCGLVSLCLSIMQGGAILTLRSEPPLHARAQTAAIIGALGAALLFTIAGFWVAQREFYVFTTSVNPAMAPTPLAGPGVTLQQGALLANYHAHPLLWLFPAIGLLAMLTTAAATISSKPILAWWSGAIAWFSVIFTTGSAMFPFLMPSSTAPAQSLTIWNASGSAYNLSWMLGFALVFTPLIIAYTSWCFRVMRGKRNTAQILNDTHSY